MSKGYRYPQPPPYYYPPYPYYMPQPPADSEGGYPPRSKDEPDYSAMGAPPGFPPYPGTMPPMYPPVEGRYAPWGYPPPPGDMYPREEEGAPRQPEEDAGAKGHHKGSGEQPKGLSHVSLTDIEDYTGPIKDYKKKTYAPY